MSLILASYSKNIRQKSILYKNEKSYHFKPIGTFYVVYDFD